MIPYSLALQAPIPYNPCLTSYTISPFNATNDVCYCSCKTSHAFCKISKERVFHSISVGWHLYKDFPDKCIESLAFIWIKVNDKTFIHPRNVSTTDQDLFAYSKWVYIWLDVFKKKNEKLKISGRYFKGVISCCSRQILKWRSYLTFQRLPFIRYVFRPSNLYIDYPKSDIPSNKLPTETKSRTTNLQNNE